MKKRIISLISIALVVTLMIACIPAHADEKDGWISITIGDEHSQFERKGIELEIYLIARGNYGDWTMEKDFADITVATRKDGSAHANISLIQIGDRIDKRGIKPTGKQASDANGKVEFKNLEHGIYYVMCRNQHKDVEIGAMFLSSPTKEGDVTVRVNAKAKYVEPTPSPTPTEKPTMTPFVPEETPNRKVPPTRTPAPPTPTPAPTPSPTPDADKTPVPKHPPELPPEPGETPIPLDDYETALGLGNIQMHVGVCFD